MQATRSNKTPRASAEKAPSAPGEAAELPKPSEAAQAPRVAVAVDDLNYLSGGFAYRRGDTIAVDDVPCFMHGRDYVYVGGESC